MRDRESAATTSMATKNDVAGLLVRIENEERNDYVLATKSDLIAVQKDVQNISQNVSQNVVSKQEFAEASKDIADNKIQLSNLNAGFSVMKTVGAVCGALIMAALTAIGIWKGKT